MRKIYLSFLCMLSLVLGTVAGSAICVSTNTAIEMASSNVNINDVVPTFFTGRDKTRVPRVSSRKMRRMIQSSVALRVRASTGNLVTIGSGTIFDHDKLGLIVISAEHVSVAAFPSTMYACSVISDDCVSLGETFVAEADTGHITSDWSIYRLSELPDTARAIDRTSTSSGIGDKIWMIGHPFGVMPWVASGNIAWEWQENGSLMYAVDGFAAPGFSGGGAFNENGELVGIVVAIMHTRWGPQTQQVLVVPISNLWVLDF